MVTNSSFKPTPIRDKADTKKPETIEFQNIPFDIETETYSDTGEGLETETQSIDLFSETETVLGEDNLETETFWIDGFSTPFNLAGLRRNVQQYANKFHQNNGRPETNISNGKKFFLKYISRAKINEVNDLKQMLRKSYPIFLNEILK